VGDEPIPGCVEVDLELADGTVAAVLVTLADGSAISQGSRSSGFANKT
jgi:hypothetical protein